MKIDLNTIDVNSFHVKDGVIANHPVKLIVPKEQDCVWTRDNLHLRSVIVDMDGNVLSKAFNKFFNYSEKPDNYPDPTNFTDWVFTSKEDGSLAICDYIYDILNVRTRGTFNYTTLDTADDFYYVINKYNILNVTYYHQDYTFLFELYSPNHIIVLNPYKTDPEIVFLGAINKKTNVYYPFYSDFGKDIVAKLNCKVPEIFKIDGDIRKIAENIKLWEKTEGVVLNYNNGQNLVKMKTDWYLYRHGLKANISNINNMVDLFFTLNCPDYDTLFKNIENTVDFETAMENSGNMHKVLTAHEMANSTITEVRVFVEYNKHLSRKDFAAKVFETYTDKDLGLSSLAFSLFNRGEVLANAKKKLLLHFLQK